MTITKKEELIRFLNKNPAVLFAVQEFGVAECEDGLNHTGVPNHNLTPEHVASFFKDEFKDKEEKDDSSD
jgi:hypothetical protein